MLCWRTMSARFFLRGYRDHSTKFSFVSGKFVPDKAKA